MTLTRVQGSFVKIQDIDDPAINPETSSVVEKIKANYIIHEKISNDTFNLKILEGARVIGPFTSNIAESIARKINGYCSSKRARGEL